MSNSAAAVAGLAAIAITCGVCSVFGRGQRSRVGADAGVTQAPAAPAAAAPAAVDEGVDDAAAAAEVQRNYRGFCIPGRRRRDPEECPDWYHLVAGVSVRRRANGTYRAEVRTLIPARSPLAERHAGMICAQTMLGLPGGGVANMSGTVKVLMLNGHVIAHNNFGRCTTGLW